MPLPGTPPSGPPRAPLLPRFCELEESDDWHECQDSLTDFSRNISSFSTESTPGLTTRPSAPTSGAASPVGSGPSQIVQRWDCTSGYRTPDRPRGFVRCFERPEPPKRRQSTSSVQQLSQEALLAPARELRRSSMVPPVDAEKAQKDLEETRELLQRCITDLTQQTMYDQMLEKFRPFLSALSRAEALLRREKAEPLLGALEPKGRILTFILDLHQQKRQYRRQTACSLNVLLQCQSWLEAYLREGLLPRTPQDLLLALPVLQRPMLPEPKRLNPPVPEHPQEGLEAMPPSISSPTRREAVEADVKVVREKRARRATRRPEEPLGDLLLKSRDQAEALGYAAGGDPDEVQVAFETFHRAVRQAFEKSSASKGRVKLEGLASKCEMVAFLVDVGVKRKAWRSRVFYVLTKLTELEAWQTHLQSPEVQEFLDAQSPAARRSAWHAGSPMAESPQHSEPEPEQSAPHAPQVKSCGASPTQVEEGEACGTPSWRDMARLKAPWYVRMCFSVLGVDRTLRFCKCFVPRDIHQMADWSRQDPRIFICSDMDRCYLRRKSGQLWS
ncbi:unnamed protein product [Durusdinium trenchii]|uniref:Uncharacterized protein n=1 Tax=Durusdinium trenchii TaxID=1381693 RepID=A0ABP0HWJ3_9DINO